MNEQPVTQFLEKEKENELVKNQISLFIQNGHYDMAIGFIEQV